MICLDPKARWTATQLLQHCWLMSNSEVKEVEIKCCSYNPNKTINIPKKNNFFLEPEFVYPIVGGCVVIGILLLIANRKSDRKTNQ